MKNDRDNKGRFLKGRKYTKKERKQLSKLISGKNNPFYGKHHTKKTKKLISRNHIGVNKGHLICTHHIDLNRENNKKSNLLKLISSKHHQLHWKSYEYLVSIGGIYKYIKWFKKEYGFK